MTKKTKTKTKPRQRHLEKTFNGQFERLVTFETLDQGDEEKGSD